MVLNQRHGWGYRMLVAAQADGEQPDTTIASAWLSVAPPATSAVGTRMLVCGGVLSASNMIGSSVGLSLGPNVPAARCHVNLSRSLIFGGLSP